MLAAAMSPEETQQIPNIAVVEIERDHVPEDDKGNYKEVHWVTYALKGHNGATNRERVTRLKKNTLLWPVIEPVYERWLKGQDQSSCDGTPLDAWPAVTKGQVKKLREMYLASVEDVAGMNDAAMQRFGMGARVLRDKAKAFVAAKAGESVIAEQLSLRDEQIAELRHELEEAQAAIASLSQGRKRGRPPKDAANRQSVE